MRLHWGTGVMAGFALFVLAVLFMVGLSMTKPVDLVNDHYYDNGLKYQERIGTLRRTAALKAKVFISVAPEGLTVQLPQGSEKRQMAGTITLYRPSSRMKDFTVPLAPDSAGSQRIPTANLERGLWRIQVSWKAGDAEYYCEQPVMIL
jgi:nitrogen fixation protein FixH